MNKTLFITTTPVLLSILFSACAPISIGIAPPRGADGSGGTGGGNSQPEVSNILLYVPVAAVVLIAVVALLRK